MSSQKRIQGLFLSALVLMFCLAVPFLLGQTKVKPRETLAAPSGPEKTGEPAQPTSSKPDDAALAQEIDRALAESDVRQARWGVFVVSMNDGRIVYSHNADELFTPASNMKVYTTAVALDTLGADYRWRTSVYCTRPPDSAGVVDGDLTLYGRGSPDLVNKSKGTAPSLTELADQLYRAGIREVRGDIVGDESYFRGDSFGLGWQWNDLQWYYG